MYNFNKAIKYCAAFVMFVFFSLPCFSQRIITGKLLDYYTKNPVENASVVIYKGTQATLTNKNGYFQLTIQDKDSLIITHKDYKVAIIGVPDVDVFAVYVEKQNYYPAYIDGVAQLYAYLFKNLKYPGTPRQNTQDQLLLVHLMVDSLGRIASCTPINHPGDNFERAAIPIFKKIPGTWSASKGSSSFIFPVVYKVGIKESEVEIPRIQLPEGKIMDQVTVYADVY